MRRAQTSIEFLILLGFMILIFGAVFGFTTQKFASTNEDLELQSLAIIGQSILDEVSVADQVNEGYMRTFTIPPAILDRQYVVMINGSRDLSLHSTNFEYVLFFPVDVVIDGGTDGLLAERNVIAKDATGITITSQ